MTGNPRLQQQPYYCLLSQQETNEIKRPKTFIREQRATVTTIVKKQPRILVTQILIAVVSRDRQRPLKRSPPAALLHRFNIIFLPALFAVLTRMPIKVKTANWTTSKDPCEKIIGAFFFPSLLAFFALFLLRSISSQCKQQKKCCFQGSLILLEENCQFFISRQNNFSAVVRYKMQPMFLSQCLMLQQKHLEWTAIRPFL